MQAIECGLPIVTREGRFMRGRLASGILKRIGLQELVADSEDQYVALTVRLASDRQYSRAIRQKIEVNRHMLYDDREPVRALEGFLVEACQKAAGETGNTVLRQPGLPEVEPAPTSSKETSVSAPAIFVWQQLEAGLHMQTLKQDYAPVGLLEMISPPMQRVLDVGCFCGGTGKWLKGRFPGCHVTGIEYLEAAAAIAAKTYDHVIRRRIEDIDFDQEGIVQGSIDIIVAADVLEHLYNPWLALERLRPLLAPNGAMYVSLPNIRNLNILKGLAEGRWPYSGAGILDITHIRFFTRTQALEMLEQTGWQVVAQRINPDPSLSHLLQGKDISKIHRVDAGILKLEGLSVKDVHELFALQFFLKAMPMDGQRASKA
jgi:2-polyprenyl-3-methyl-5-hydroxy-6-metoxy-1,4-benzoquinol methylase